MVAARTLRAPSVARRHRMASPTLVCTLLAVLIAGVAVVGINLGVARLSPVEVWQTLIGDGTGRQELVLYQLRMPRILVAVMIGIGLALAGAVMQAVTENVLADPGILGINASAGVAVFLLMIVRAADTPASKVVNASPYALPFAALVGGCLGAVLVYAFAYKRGTVTPTRLLLVGVAIGFAATAVIPILVQRMQRPDLYIQAVSWLEGNFAIATWDSVIALLPWVAVLAPFVWAKSRVLNVLNLGDAVATGLGANVQRQRVVLIASAVGLAASSVAIGGGVAFVGLVAPHVARRLVGPDHRTMLPCAALVGASFVAFADLLARNAFSPFEVPVGIVVAVIGAPYFLYLLVRTVG